MFIMTRNRLKLGNIKLKIIMGNYQSSPAVIEEKFPIAAPSKTAKFALINKSQDTEKPHLKSTEFKILSYNILADCYTRASWFPGSNPKNLPFKKRSALIVNFYYGFYNCLFFQD